MAISRPFPICKDLVSNWNCHFIICCFSFQEYLAWWWIFFGGVGGGGCEPSGGERMEWCFCCDVVFVFENNPWLGFDCFIWHMGHMGMEVSEWSKILSVCYFVVFIPWFVWWCGLFTKLSSIRVSVFSTTDPFLHTHVCRSAMYNIKNVKM